MLLSKGFYVINFYKRLSAVNDTVYKTCIIKFNIYRLYSCVINLSYKINYCKIIKVKKLKSKKLKF